MGAASSSFDNMEILNSHKRLDHSESGISQTPAGVGRFY
jgi:hypothetical protein